jgi:hypothetical protein
MGSHGSFGYLKHKLWPNERLGVRLPIRFHIIKSRELPWFTCVQVTCHIPLEQSWLRLQLCFRHHLNLRSTQEVMGLQNYRRPNFENFGILNLGVPGQNDIWVQALCSSTKNTIRGKVVATPKFGLWWILWVRVCPWFIRA